MKLKKLAGILAIAGLAVPGIASATNGYFAHGYGMKSKGMAGVGIALPQDALAAATNPAGMVWVGNRIDFGADLFKPNRTTTLTAAIAAGTPGDYSGNGDSVFLIPEFGYNLMLGSNSSVGISVYGNGGMNTNYEDYNARAGAAAFGAGPLGVDLIQLFIAPTYAVKVTPDHSLGVSLILAYQRFKAEGLGGFAGFSTAGTALSNVGYDSSTGYGLKFGWTGKVTPDVTVGATYQTETKMSKFDKYRGLFAEQGDFDIPETYGLGIAVKATPKMTIAADVQQINYSKIPSIANPIDNLVACAAAGGGATGNANCLGGSNGGGFGWEDMTVFKLGIDYQYDQNLVLRGGISTTRQPIPTSQTRFNIVAPAVVENHLTLGATWTLADKSELTVGYMHAFSKTINGTGVITAAGPANLGGQGINLKMVQDSIGVAYGWKLQ